MRDIRGFPSHKLCVVYRTGKFVIFVNVVNLSFRFLLFFFFFGVLGYRINFFSKLLQYVHTYFVTQEKKIICEEFLILRISR